MLSDILVLETIAIDPFLQKMRALVNSGCSHLLPPLWICMNILLFKLLLWEEPENSVITYAYSVSYAVLDKIFFLSVYRLSVFSNIYIWYCASNQKTGKKDFMQFRVCVWGGGGSLTKICVWRSEGNLWESFISYCVGSGDWIQVAKFGAVFLHGWIISPNQIATLK